MARLGQVHGGVERAGFVDLRAEDEDWVPRCGETRCQALYDRVRYRTDRGDVACHQEVGRILGGGGPIVKGHGDEDGPARRERGGMNGTRQCRRHVLRSRRLDTPLHERSRKLSGVNVRELGLQRHHRASLLSGYDHERRMRDGGVDQHAHGIAEAGGRMQVDEHRPPGRLGVAVSHA